MANELLPAEEPSSSEVPVNFGERPSDGDLAPEESAEHRLLLRDFGGARDASLAALDAMVCDELGTGAAVRLAFVLGQSLFELDELADSDKRYLRRVFGSFKSIPDEVVVLWLALLARKGERETLRRFSDAFVKLNSDRLADVSGGAFAQVYAFDVLCEALGEPGRAREFAEGTLSGKGDAVAREALLARIEEHEASVAAEEDDAERRVAEEPEAAQAEAAGEEDHAGDKEGEGAGAGAPWAERLAERAAGLDQTQALVAGALGATFLYALYTERRTLRDGWSRLSGRVKAGGRALGGFLVGD